VRLQVSKVAPINAAARFLSIRRSKHRRGWPYTPEW